MNIVIKTSDNPSKKSMAIIDNNKKFTFGKQKIFE